MKTDFERDTRNHKLTVLRDDGLYRHLQFKQPGTRNMQFELITWPGYLAYCGDMGDFMFTRLDDMFAFFRTDAGRINPRYWAEKMVATDKNGGHKQFSDKAFEQTVISELVTWIREHRYKTTKEQRRDLWDAVVSEVIDAESCPTGQYKFDAAIGFNHRIGADATFEFVDFWDHNFDEYTYHYLWCCNAIVWGIQQYDQFKAAPQQPAEVQP